MSMKACVLHAPRDLRLEEQEAGAPGPGEVLVHVGAGGICGSDLHYYFHGGFGAVRLREPMVLGHEVAGVVAAIGAGVTRVKPGDQVAVNPSRPCGQCGFCLAGQPNHCANMQFYGSAMRFPHIQGAFRQALRASESQCELVSTAVSVGEAAFAEPLSCGLHAVERAGQVAGRRVLVTGAGPIGALAVAAARNAGAAEIVATDIAAAPLAKVAEMGADRVIDVSKDAGALAAYGADKGRFDVMIEASGSDKALRAGLEVVRPQGVIVQMGLGGGESTLPLNMLVAKELELRGTFRFHPEFARAARLIGARRIDVRPLLTDSIPFAEHERAFALAADRAKAIKVQLTF
jgi:L-idonate 5-dehydrogenase